MLLLKSYQPSVSPRSKQSVLSCRCTGDSDRNVRSPAVPAMTAPGPKRRYGDTSAQCHPPKRIGLAVTPLQPSAGAWALRSPQSRAWHPRRSPRACGASSHLDPPSHQNTSLGVDQFNGGGCIFQTEQGSGCHRAPRCPSYYRANMRQSGRVCPQRPFQGWQYP